MGFELTVEASWALKEGGGSGGTVASGTVKLLEVSDTEADLIGDYKVTCSSCNGTGGLTSDAAAKIVRGAQVSHFVRVLKEWIEAIKSGKAAGGGAGSSS